MPERVMEPAKGWLDAISIGGVVATLAGYLPAMAAALSIVWTAIRIYETKTVQGWLGKRRRRSTDK
jgi:chromate transport protein ChrA